MDVCENCSAASLHSFLPRNYDSLSSAEQAAALKSAVKVLEDERKMYVKSGDIRSVESTDKDLTAARGALEKLKEDRENENIAIEAQIEDKEALLIAARAELADIEIAEKDMQDGKLAADEDDVRALAAKKLNCKLRLANAHADIKKLSSELRR